MHIVVIGLGAIGGFYGTLLVRYAKANPALRVSFVARAATYTALKDFGSRLMIKKNNFGEMQETLIVEKDLNLYESYNSVPIKDDEDVFVLLCTKSKDTIEVCNDIKSKLTNKTHVVSIQNGVENESRISSVLGLGHAIGALTNIAAETLEPGVFLQKGNYGLIIGELDETLSARVTQLNDILNAAGINSKISKHIQLDMWSKLVWNASFNPLSVLYEKTTGQLLENLEHRRSIELLMQETRQVAEAEGHKLPADIVENHISRTDVPEWYDFRPSSLQDFQNRKSLEIDDLLGVVIRVGVKHGIATPEARRIYDLIQEKLLGK